MAIIKDFGIVLKEFEAGESNKKLVVLTGKHGKMTVFARGARRAQSKLAAGLFDYNEFVIFDGGGFLSLNAVVPVHSFGGITADYDKYCFACCFLEMTDKMTLTGMDTQEVLQILLCALAELERGRHEPTTVFAVFAIKFLQKEGFAPLVSGHSVQTGTTVLRPTPRAVQALEYILEASPKEMFAFKASEDVAGQLYRAARLFVAENVDTGIKSLEMIGD